MGTCVCNRCHATIPIRDSFNVLGVPHCEACTDLTLQEIPGLKAGDVERGIDPTICARCGAENGIREWERLGRLPLCSPCRSAVLNRPFPDWVKAAAAVLAILMVAALASNLRFIRAYSELKKASAAIESGLPREAAEWFGTAAAHVPEVRELSLYEDYFAGVALMAEEKPGEALNRFMACRDGLPEEYMIDEWIASAQSSLAFDQHDYPRFLALERERYAQDSGDSRRRLALASALACMYAESGEQRYAVEAQSLIEQVGGSEIEKPAADFVMRIRHRLQTRTILSPVEFNERYPDGWRVSGEVP